MIEVKSVKRVDHHGAKRSQKMDAWLLGWLKEQTLGIYHVPRGRILTHNNLSGAES